MKPKFVVHHIVGRTMANLQTHVYWNSFCFSGYYHLSKYSALVFNALYRELIEPIDIKKYYIEIF